MAHVPVRACGSDKDGMLEDDKERDPDLTEGIVNSNSSLEDEHSVNGSDVPVDSDLQGKTHISNATECNTCTSCTSW